MSDIPTTDVAAAQAGAPTGLLLDVREHDEWAAGHAPGAVHIPMGDLQADQLPTDKTIYCICRSGGRSARVVQAMLGAGFDAVNVEGGMNAWSAAGYDVVTDDGSPGTVI